MDTRSGEIYDKPQLEEELKGQTFEYRKNFIPVRRNLTLRERNDKQILLYAPCACGSGKKFKFCCKQDDEGDSSAVAD